MSEKADKELSSYFKHNALDVQPQTWTRGLVEKQIEDN